MHVGPLAEELDLGVIAPPVVVVADVQRHVQVLDQVDQEPQRDPTLLERPAAILEDGPELADLRHDVPLLGCIAGESIAVAVLVERDVDVMPGPAPLDVPPMLIGPGRGGGHRLARLEQLHDGRLRLRGQVLLGQTPREAMAQRRPGPGGGA